MARLPTGTVTFLFTDIEGSTRLLQELGPDRYERLQDDHAEIVRKAIAAEQGTELRTEGDSFVVVFPTPAGALRAAVGAQRDLAETEIRVRMGLHTGEGRLGGDDYVGIDINRAARIASSGHGGQVLLSDTTRSLVEHDLPDGVAIRDLGAHRLKDIEHPEHLFDLAIDGLPSDFPPPRTLDARPTNLPQQLTAFVGRKELVAETIRLLGEQRLVTLTGPGGTGKTRLAQAAAADLLPSYPDGVCFVDLAPLGDPDAVPVAVARALGLREEPGRALIDTVSDHVAEREVLLIPDNFEHVLDATPVVEHLLQAGPRLRILATSRSPLGLYGEQELPVPPLALPDPTGAPEVETMAASEAVALFVDRARRVSPDFELTDQNVATVAEICARLDGLPLAIELAASRIKVLPPEAILARLSRSSDLLTTEARNLPTRQRTLRAAMDWSYGLLDEPDRRLFARLSVFVGGADLEAVEAVVDGDHDLDVLQGLGSLIDHSLVRRIETNAGGPRFDMLRTIREYARERCELEWDEEATRRRHAEHFLTLAEAAGPHLDGRGQMGWLDRLDREQGNVEAALRWAGDHDPERGMLAAAGMWRFWQVRGDVATGRDLLEGLLALPGERSVPRAVGEDAVGSLAYWQSDGEGAERHYREALAIARELGDRRVIAQATYDLAFVPMILGTGFEESARLLPEAVELFESLGDEERAVRARGDLGLFMLIAGDHRAALPLLEESLARTRERGDVFHVADDLLRLAEANRFLGNLDDARRDQLEALEIMERANAPGGIAAVLQIMASVDSDLGRHERAMRIFGSADSFTERAGGFSEPPPFQFADPVGAARQAIGDEATERAMAEGRAVSREEALAYARSDQG
jgi:predicted ATPase/class 3 adenylate cyclase